MGCGVAMVSAGLLGQSTIGWAVGRAMGCATAGAMVAVPTGRVASMMLALASPGSVVTLAQSVCQSVTIFSACRVL